MHDYYQWRIEWGDRSRRTDGRYLTDLWTDEAVQFIERHSSQPFFLHVTFNAPHVPLQAPAEEVAPFLGKAGINKGVASLYGMLRRIEQGVGRILETLERLGLRQNTIVLFSSDNGPQFGGEGEECLTRYNCQFNGAKGTVYEGGIRVPMILRWPDGLPAGKEVSEMVHFSDWLPTILAMAEAQLPQGNLPLDGVNVLPVLRGENGKVQTKRCWQWNRYTPVGECNAAIRDGRWKLVRSQIPQAMEVYDLHWLWVSMYGPEHFIHNGILSEPEPQRKLPAPPATELYDLEADPLELQDLAAQNPQVVSKLEKELTDWFIEVETERRANGG